MLLSEKYFVPFPPKYVVQKVHLIQVTQSLVVVSGLFLGTLGKSSFTKFTLISHAASNILFLLT